MVDFSDCSFVAKNSLFLAGVLIDPVDERVDVVGTILAG